MNGEKSKSDQLEERLIEFAAGIVRFAAELPRKFDEVDDSEIRTLWVDGLDNLVFAASSCGNAESRDSGLPTFFILEIQ